MNHSQNLKVSTLIMTALCGLSTLAQEIQFQKELVVNQEGLAYQMSFSEDAKCVYMPKVSALEDLIVKRSKSPCNFLDSFEGTSPEARFWHEEAQNLKKCMKESNFKEMDKYCEGPNGEAAVIPASSISSYLDFLERSPRGNIFLKVAVVDHNNKLETFKINPSFSFEKADDSQALPLKLESVENWSLVDSVTARARFSPVLSESSEVSENDIKCILVNTNGDYLTRRLSERYANEGHSLGTLNEECAKNLSLEEIETQLEVRSHYDTKTIHKPFAGLRQIFGSGSTVMKEWKIIEPGHSVSQVRARDVREDNSKEATDLVIILKSGEYLTVNLKPSDSEAGINAAKSLLPKVGEKMSVK